MDEVVVVVVCQNFSNQINSKDKDCSEADTLVLYLVDTNSNVVVVVAVGSSSYAHTMIATAFAVDLS